MKYKIKICPHCNWEFKNIEGRSFSNHIRWCDKNTTNGDKGLTNIKKSIRKSVDKKKGKIIKIQKICIWCGNKFIVKKRKLTNRWTKSFCCRSCANSYSQTFVTYDENHSKKTSNGVKKKWEDKNYAQRCLNNKKFTSKNEIKIREYFCTNFKNDE